MSGDDPRLQQLIPEVFGHGTEGRTRRARRMLALLDAVDPLRQAATDDDVQRDTERLARVIAADIGDECWTDYLSTARAALAAMRPTTGTVVGNDLLREARALDGQHCGCIGSSVLLQLPDPDA
jgi:hypothetical protein